jgi:hypothetical protein
MEMEIAMTPRTATLVVVCALSLGCGSDACQTAPTTRPFAIEVLMEGPLAAHATFCSDFRQESSGEAYANAGVSLPVEIGVGRCAGARTVGARGDRGEVTATLPAADSFVRVENTSDSSTRYRLTLRYLVVR